MVIQAIETRYAGCRFRSRLEARWAVFFDTLNIKWEYEPEGIRFDTHTYLPDFWLPREKIYVEVKGDDSLATPEYRAMLADAIDYNTTPLSQGLLLLGPVPDVRNATIVLHSHLSWRKGVELDSRAFRIAPSWDYGWLASPYEGIGGYSDSSSAPEFPSHATWNARVLRIELCGTGGRWFPMQKQIKEAYEAARSARFEHGESG